VKFVHVQSVMPQEDVIALKVKTGEKSVKEAISKAVYHYMECQSDKMTEHDAADHTETVKLELNGDAFVFGFDAKNKKFVYQTPTEIVGERTENHTPVLVRKGEVLKITITKKA
jgi:Family of unknown function (DUF5371)